MKKAFLLNLVFILIFYSCSQPERKTAEVELPEIAVKPGDFETVVNGKDVKLFNLTNENGMIVQVTNFGASIVTVLLPGKNEEYIDVALGYNSVEGYINDIMNLGCVIGRYANRIAKGSFEIDGVKYQLEINNGENTLHSGSAGYNKVVWDAYQKGDSIVMHYVSPHMESGFPGELNISLVYVLTDDNKFEMIYEAETSAKTVINLTNHSYFNMAGEGAGDILNQYIRINADSITPVSKQLIPTGKLMPVEGTPFDLREEVLIGKMIGDPHEQIINGNGYDHNWVLNKQTPGEMSFAASYRDSGTGFTLKVATTEPGIQMYSGNFMDGSITGKSGRPYNFRNALALETQHFPDSPNHPVFPSTILEPGQKYYQKTVLEFEF